MRLIAVPYYGGKHVHAKWIISLLPTNHDHYVEPFCGGASVLLNKFPSPLETMNDLSGDVANFFQMLRDRGDELVEKLRLTAFARDELTIASRPTDDQLERARRFYVRARQSINGLVVNESTWRCVVKKAGRSNPPVNFEKQVDKLPEVIARLRRVQIENRPALNVIKRFDRPTTLFYCDPPYAHNSRTSTDSYGTLEMTDDDHRLLAEQLRSCEGKVAISGYRCDLYDELYGSWTRHDKETVSSASGTQGKSPKRVESVWCNYDLAIR